MTSRLNVSTVAQRLLTGSLEPKVLAQLAPKDVRAVAQSVMGRIEKLSPPQLEHAKAVASTFTHASRKAEPKQATALAYAAYDVADAIELARTRAVELPVPRQPLEPSREDKAFHSSTVAPLLKAIERARNGAKEIANPRSGEATGRQRTVEVTREFNTTALRHEVSQVQRDQFDGLIYKESDAMAVVAARYRVVNPAELYDTPTRVLEDQDILEPAKILDPAFVLLTKAAHSKSFARILAKAFSSERGLADILAQPRELPGPTGEVHTALRQAAWDLGLIEGPRPGGPRHVDLPSNGAAIDWNEFQRYG